MIEHRLFVKGEILYALLSSNSNPNIVMPVKGIVKDVQYDNVNPKYLIKVTKFYDNFYFLKKNLFNMSFKYTFERRARNLVIDESEIKNMDDLLELLDSDNQARYYFVVDSIMTKKFLGELMILSNKIQDFILEKKFREIREAMKRNSYKGKYKLESEFDFRRRFTKFIGDLIEKQPITLEKYFDIL